MKAQDDPKIASIETEMKTIVNKIILSEKHADIFKPPHRGEERHISSCKLDISSSKLTKLYLSLNRNLKNLTLYLKYLLKRYNLHGTGKITTHVLFWLVVYFMQQRNLLPSVMAIRKSVKGKHQYAFGWDCSVPDEFTFCSSLHGSLYLLLLDFFKFYGQFDFSNYVISPFLGHSLPICDIGERKRCFLHSMNIQHPIIHNFNLANQVGGPPTNEFTNLCRFAYKRLPDCSTVITVRPLQHYLLYIDSPAEFARLMKLVLDRLPGIKIAKNYLDDILIPVEHENELLINLRVVLSVLRQANLTCRVSKCYFVAETVEFLGFIIGDGQLKPGISKIKAIEEFPKPQNAHEIRRFIGLTSFFRRFIPRFAQKAEPLTRLTRKDATFIWNEEQDSAFSELVNALCSKPVLRLYNPNAETELHTDASALGLAGMLLQKGDDNNFHLVYCVSRETTPEESRYHSSKLELLAVAWSANSLRKFLIGIKFTVVTDCQALIFLNSNKTSNPQISRWACLLREFKLQFRHREGVRMAHVDAPSRAPLEEASESFENDLLSRTDVLLNLTAEDEVALLQTQDSEIKMIKYKLCKEVATNPKELRTLRENFAVESDVLFRIARDKKRVKKLFVVPKSMRKSIVIRYHDQMGHVALDRVLREICESYWFPRMSRYVKLHIKLCLKCRYLIQSSSVEESWIAESHPSR